MLNILSLLLLAPPYCLNIEDEELQGGLVYTAEAMQVFTAGAVKGSSWTAGISEAGAYTAGAAMGSGYTAGIQEAGAYTAGAVAAQLES